MDQLDGLGRDAGARLVDSATGAVDAEKLREFAALCDLLAANPLGLRWAWQRFAARVAFTLTGRCARDVAEQIETWDLPMRAVREQLTSTSDARHV